MSRLSLLAIAALLLGASPAFVQEAELARPNPVLRQIVESMPKGDRQEVHLMTAAFKPGDRTVFHTHRFPVTVYVLEGTFTLEMEGRGSVTVKAGEGMVEPPSVRMTGYNRGSGPLRVVIFYVAEPGTPFLDVLH